MISRQVFYEGRVQGVGFRWTVKNVARGFDVVGSVRNLEDGRVELHVRGEDDEVAAFLEAVAESDLKSHIKRVETHPLADMSPTRGFEIVQ